MGQFTMPEDGEFTENDIDKYVTDVKVYEDHFEWLLNLDTDTRGELDDAVHAIPPSVVSYLNSETGIGKWKKL